MTLHTIATDYRRATSIDELQTDADDELYAGGTDTIPLARAGLLGAATLVDVTASGLPDGVDTTDDEWVVGTLTTLADLARHDGLAGDAPAIGIALRQAATPQIRNRATVGGNLLQRPRCSYFRDPDVSCWMKGGDDCPARTGHNEHHGLTGDECVAVQPSDLASVLVALDATLSITRPGATDGDRRLSVAEFLAPPTPERRALHTLGRGEVIETIRIPRSSTRRSTYVKAMDRAAWQFALVGVAAVVDVDDDAAVSSARLVASGVSTTPWELSDAASALVGRPLDSASIAAAVAESGAGLTPLAQNGYKLPLLAGLVRRSLDELTRTTKPEHS